MDTFVITLFLIICILLIVVVLLQKGRGGGLGGAFGGIGQSAFGTRTGDVFTWVTIVLTGVFLLLSVGSVLFFRPPAETVAQPSFVPDGKPIAKAINVTIQCREPKAEVFFTVTPLDAPDAGDPTRSSLRYDTPVRVEPGTRLKAKGFLHGWRDSELAVADYPRLTATGAVAPPLKPPTATGAGAPSPTPGSAPGR